ncbi:MAG: type II secretion system F family protein, partial [Actinoallomurus sp.]
MFLELSAVATAGLAGLVAVSGDDVSKRLGRLFAPEHGAVLTDPRSGGTGGGSGPVPSGFRMSESRSGATEGLRRDRVRPLVSLLAGLVCALLLGGPVGWVAGVLVAVGLMRLLARLEPRAVRARRARVVAELPIAVDLLAACLRGGGAWHESVEAVAGAVGGPLGAELAHVAARIRLGADPAAE